MLRMSEVTTPATAAYTQAVSANEVNTNAKTYCESIAFFLSILFLCDYMWLNYIIFL